MLPEFITRLFPTRQNEKRVLTVGLDAAGKTTFLYLLHLGEIVTTIPTIGFNVETVKVPTSGGRGPLQLTCWDVGGCDKIRPLFRHYMTGMDALVWIHDSNDRERLSEAREELRRMLEDIDRLNPHNTTPTPCLILANKQDLPGAMKLDEVRIQLAPVISTRPSCAVFPTSFISGNNLTMLTPAMNWLYDVLAGVPPTSPIANPSAGQAPTDELSERLNSWVERASQDVAPGDFIQAFESISLPSWDHYTHIRIAYTILRLYGRQKGKTMIFDGLENYIKTSAQTTGRTFHVTMTYFWIQVVHFGMQSMPPDIPQSSEGNADFCRFLLLNPYLVDGNLWADYYSKDVMMTPEAKARMVLPNKKPLPNLIARDAIRK